MNERRNKGIIETERKKHFFILWNDQSCLLHGVGVGANKSVYFSVYIGGVGCQVWYCKVFAFDTNQV